MRLNSYENANLYKQRTKWQHDKLIRAKVFKEGDKVLLFNSRLKLFAGKLRSRWDGPYEVTKVYPYGVVEVEDLSDGRILKVNGQRLKPYLECKSEIGELVEGSTLEEPQLDE